MSRNSHRTRIAITGLAVGAIAAALGGCTAVDRHLAPTPHIAPSPVTTPDYSSTAFRVPLTVRLPTDVSPHPATDTPAVLTWIGQSRADDKIRFLIPVKYYPPASSTAKAVTADYPAYLAGLFARGATTADHTTIPIDGRAVSVQTVIGLTTDSGDLGCSSRSATQHGDGCFGIGVDYAVRLAVVSHGDHTVLVWARRDLTDDDHGFFDRFDRMLETLTFD